MDHIEIKAHVCVWCREQVEGYDDYEVTGHHHEGHTWPVYEVELSYETFMTDFIDELDRKKAEFEQELEDAARRVRENKVRHRYEVLTWLATAPNEQVWAWKQSQRNHRQTVEIFSKALKDSFGEDLNRQLYGQSTLLFGDPPNPQVRLDDARHSLDIEEGVVKLFEEKGPAAISFWRVRRARERISELREKIERLIKSVSQENS